MNIPTLKQVQAMQQMQDRLIKARASYAAYKATPAYHREIKRLNGGFYTEAENRGVFDK